MNANPIGSSLDDFLQEEGVFEDMQWQAIKEVIAWQLEQAMREQGITQAQLAVQMKTSPAQVGHLLNTDNDITLGSLQRAAALLGRKVRVDLVAENQG